MWLHVADLEQSLMKEKIDVRMFFFQFLCSGIPNLALRILKMLICVCFHDVTSLTICCWHDMALSQFVQ